MIIENNYEHIKKMNKEQLADFLFKFCCSCNGGFSQIKEKKNFGYNDFLNFLNKTAVYE